MEHKIKDLSVEYTSTHTDDDCDSCQKRVGRKNLTPLPFLFCNKNDRDNHPDLSYLVGVPMGEGYRQYYVCKDCMDNQRKTFKSP